MTDLDFGLQLLLVRQLLGTNGVPGAQHGQDRASGSAMGPSHALLDGDIGEGSPMDSDSDRGRGVNFNTSVGGRDAGASDNTSVDGFDFDISSGFPITNVQRQPAGAIELSRNVAEERSSPVDNGYITNGAKAILDSPYEADICDVELTSLSPQVGCDHTFVNITSPHAFDPLVSKRPSSCRIRAVSQLHMNVF